LVTIDAGLGIQHQLLVTIAAKLPNIVATLVMIDAGLGIQHQL
jgi:hypothetical protein